MTEKRKEFLSDLAKLLKKHKVSLSVEEFDAPTWGTGTFKIQAEFEWEPGDEESTELVLGCFIEADDLLKDL